MDAVLDDEDDVAVTAITVAELLVGVELASPSYRELRKSFVEDVISSLPVIPYDPSIAQEHARILAAVKRAGRPRGAHDSYADYESARSVEFNARLGNTCGGGGERNFEVISERPMQPEGPVHSEHQLRRDRTKRSLMLTSEHAESYAGSYAEHKRSY